ncbi:hypothetical protein TNCV_1002261 [Trichonephila clavipes]|nr:hypothetical protein TNCV_1002261 [Trichonephila clavipes]
MNYPKRRAKIIILQLRVILLRRRFRSLKDKVVVVKNVRNISIFFKLKPYSHLEQFGTVIEDDYSTNVDSEKELSLEQKLELAISKKFQQTKIQTQKSTMSKTIRREIDLFEDEKLRGKHVEKIHRILLRILPTNIDAKRAHSTAGSLCT